MSYTIHLPDVIDHCHHCSLSGLNQDATQFAGEIVPGRKVIWFRWGHSNQVMPVATEAVVKVNQKKK